jgi:hypothetical protein
VWIELSRGEQRGRRCFPLGDCADPYKGGESGLLRVRNIRLAGIIERSSSRKEDPLHRGHGIDGGILLTAITIAGPEVHARRCYCAFLVRHSLVVLMTGALDDGCPTFA